MAKASLFIIMVYSLEAILAIPSQSTYLVPEHRSAYKFQTNEPVSYEYQIVPKEKYAVVESNTDLSLLDCLLSPLTVLITVGSAALSVSKWLISKGVFVFLGIAMTFGFCAFTPFCTLTINAPFVKDLGSILCSDDIEYYFHEAYNKFHDMQSYLY